MMKKMTSLAAVAVLAGALTVQADEQQRPEVGRYVQAYSGDFNSSVFLVRLGAKEKAEALVLISGIDHELDGQVLKASILVRDDSRRSLMVKEGDESRELMRLEGSSAQLFVSSAPFGPTGYALGYNGDLSRGAEVEHILTRWLENPR